MSEIANLLAELVRIDSVNPDLVPGGAGEGELAAFVAAWLERAGLDVELQETAPGRPNVIGRVRGRGQGRSLMLNARLSTASYGRNATMTCAGIVRNACLKSSDVVLSPATTPQVFTSCAAAERPPSVPRSNTAPGCSPAPGGSTVRPAPAEEMTSGTQTNGTHSAVRTRSGILLLIAILRVVHAIGTLARECGHRVDAHRDAGRTAGVQWHSIGCESADVGCERQSAKTVLASRLPPLTVGDD